MLADLKLLVECESPTEDLPACNRVVSVASEISKRVLGDPGSIIQEQGRPVLWIGSKTPEIVLLCHLDTVWPIGSFIPLWKVDGDVVSGPGCYDMKAGFIQAFMS